jgi:anti-sigma-K factor RskA
LSAATETFRRKLQEFATKDGVGTIEARVRAAIDKGNYAEANRLRTESQKLMLREAETLWRSIPGRSAEAACKRAEAGLIRQERNAGSPRLRAASRA